jgi:N-succinyldiaminopimelate aminotransferase
VRAAKQFLTFAGATPFQHAGASALGLADEFYAAFAAELKAKRDRLCDGLAAAGLTVLRPQGTYFANIDAGGDGTEFCRALVSAAGVVAIPTSVFSADPQRLAPYVRFAFCKRPDVIDEAAGRLAAHASEAARES